MWAGGLFGAYSSTDFVLTLQPFQNSWGRENAIPMVTSAVVGFVLAIPLAVTWALVDLVFTGGFQLQLQWIWYCIYPACVPVVILFSVELRD